MEPEIIDSTLLEFEKSTFIIDLMKNKDGLKYISLEQIIRSEGSNPAFRRIDINPSVLDDIIEVLSNYSSLFGEKTINKNYFSKQKKEEIQRRYLNGVNSKDLAVQFSCSENLINQILTNRGIELVSNQIPKINAWWRSKKRKK